MWPHRFRGAAASSTIVQAQGGYDVKTRNATAWQKRVFGIIFYFLLILQIGCEQPEPPDNETDSTAATWKGTQEVTVILGAEEAVVSLEGLPVSTYEGIDGVRLSDVIASAKLIADPSAYFFNFIASDGFDMSKMAIINQMGLPVWDDMTRGYFYDGGSEKGLTIRWEEGTVPGDFGRFYNCKFMDDGLIQMLDDDVW